MVVFRLGASGAAGFVLRLRRSSESVLLSARRRRRITSGVFGALPSSSRIFRRRAEKKAREDGL